MGPADFVIIGLVLAAAVLALVFHLRRKRAGRGCGCAGCAYKDACGRKEVEKCKQEKPNKQH